MAFLATCAVTFGRVATLLQVIVYLPLTLDVAGQDAFLALSASLAVYYAFLSTVRSLTRRTSLAWLGDFLAVFQFVVVPACLLIVFHAYSPPSESYFDRKYISKEASSSSSAPSSLISLASQAAAHGSDQSASTTDGMRRLFSSKVKNSAGTSTTSLPTNYAEAHSAAAAELNLGEVYLGPTLNSLLLRIVAVTFFLARRVPPWWHTFLRLSSPIFSLLEGIATLLVIQVVGSFSRWMIASSLSRRPPAPTRSYFFGWVQTIISALTSAEFLQIFFLLASAFIYVISALALYVSFEGATRNRPGAAAATGAAVSSALWLTAIAFAVRKGNVVETALVFAYVTWNVYQLADSLSFTADPLSLIRSFKVLDTTNGAPILKLDHLPPIAFILIDHASSALRQSARFGAAAAAALPKSVIVSLIYRLMVLYSASRILPLLKRQTDKPWDADGSSWSGSASGSDDSLTESDSENSSSGEESTSSFENEASKKFEIHRGKQRERRRKSGRHAQRRGTARKEAKDAQTREEEPFGAFISLIVSYARLILIAVYSHLLLLDQSHMVYWRFLTVGITLFIWALELVLGKDDNPDAAFAGSWQAS